uniref:Uncharacterized protein n=1 Tax=Opuntia streptacantha TaxID=393608 RepID=A0A7C8ZYF1_OPUST
MCLSTNSSKRHPTGTEAFNNRRSRFNSTHGNRITITFELQKITENIYRSISQMLQVHCISTFTFVADSFMKELRHLRVISMVFPFQNERKMGLSVLHFLTIRFNQNKN